MTNRIIFGCGYLGQRVAKLWRDAGDHVIVVTRSEQKATRFAEAGFTPLVADIVNSNTIGSLPVAETVLFAVGFDRQARYR